MELEQLVKKIKSDITSTDSVRGNMHYNGETQDRGSNPKFAFSYEFPQGKATDFSKYDKKDDDIDEARANIMEVGKSLLDYRLRDNLFQIRILKQSENSAKVEIYHDTKEIKKSSTGTGDDLSHYIASSKAGISNPKESDDPQSFIRGHKEWLEAH